MIKSLKLVCTAILVIVTVVSAGLTPIAESNKDLGSVSSSVSEPSETLSESEGSEAIPDQENSDSKSDILSSGTEDGKIQSEIQRPGKPMSETTSSPPPNNIDSNAGGSPSLKPSQPTPAPTPTPAGKYVVGYYTGWSAYKGYTPNKIPAGKLTHLNYAFAKIDPSKNSIALADPDNDRRNFAAFRTLKQNYKQLKTLISVGGWDYSTYFSEIASSAARREAFAQSCLDFILEHGFDGVDLDWEYPVSGGAAGNINRPQDKQNFTLLLQAIRQKFDAQGKKDGRSYYVTIAGGASTGYLSKIEAQRVADLVDYIFVMAYDMHGPWDSFADLNAPLYQPTESSPHYKISVYDGISSYLKNGIAAKKLVLGMPFYGYLYQGVSGQNNGLYSTFSSAKSISYDTVRSSYLNNSSFKKLIHSTAQVPYLYGNGTFITYEDNQSITAKASLAKALGLAGVGAWELSHDTSGSLLESAYRAFSR